MSKEIAEVGLTDDEAEPAHMVYIVFVAIKLAVYAYYVRSFL